MTAGDVQWMKTGSGIIHSEMPAMKEGKLHGFQLWINMPAKLKMSKPEYIYIDADKNQLSQVVINLIINSMDAMDGSGTLTLRTYGEPRSGKAYLEVSDTGCGIPEENLTKVFDPFFTTKAPGKGTGLGLSMAYGVLEENQGRIRVKETGPEGTTIVMQLPALADSDGLLFDSIG